MSLPAQGATVGDGWGGRAGSPSKAAAAATRASSSGAASVPVGSAAAGGAALAGGRAHNGAPGPGGALAATPPDGTTTFCATREAALYRKVERLASAVALGRCAVAAELAGVAAAEAFELYGVDSVVGADLRYTQVDQLRLQCTAVLDAPAQPLTSFESVDVLVKAAWVALLSVVAVLQQRLAAGTLLPGRCRSEEEAYFVAFESALGKAKRVAPAAPAFLRACAVAVGYGVLLRAAMLTVMLLRAMPWPAEERARSHALVHAALDAIPATAKMQIQSTAEHEFVFFLQRFFQLHRGAPDGMDPAFYASVIAKWTSPAVANVLRDRGSLQGSAALYEMSVKRSDARRQADVAAKGFRACGLVTCSLREVTVRQFKVCGGCFAVAYCSEEHASAHWNDGHRRECRHLTAAGAQPPSTADAT